MIAATLTLALAAAASHPAVVVDEKATGSWYRKVASRDGVEFDAISASGVLPQPHFDPDRMHRPAEGEGAYSSGPLDNPGIYVGAHAEGREAEAGFKWDHLYDGQGRDSGLYAWRLFWRTTTPAGNLWRNPAPGSAQDVYFLPGERFTMTLTVRPDGTARLDVRGARAQAAAVFALDGFWDGPRRRPRRFKRVHAIDQFTDAPGAPRAGNEGRAAIPTRAFLEGGRWETVVLIGSSRAPLTGHAAIEWRGGDEADAYASVFPGAVPDERGGEEIVVRPPSPERP